MSYDSERIKKAFEDAGVTTHDSEGRKYVFGTQEDIDAHEARKKYKEEHRKEYEEKMKFATPAEWAEIVRPR
jgi:hypothetical protein